MDHVALRYQVGEVVTSSGSRRATLGQRRSPQLGEDARFTISGHLVHAEVTDLHPPCDHRSGRFGDEEGLVVEYRSIGDLYRSDQAELLKFTDEPKVGTARLGEIPGRQTHRSNRSDGLRRLQAAGSG